MPGQEDAMLLALSFQLRDSQWWPAETLAAHQMAQLEPLLAHAARTVPFYARRLQALSGIKPGGLTMEAFRQIPILRRTGIQDAGDALFSRRVPKDHGTVGDTTTSGSTGRPITVRTTAVTGLFYRAINLRYHLWHGRDLAGHVAAIRSLSGAMTKAAETGDPLPWIAGYRSGPMSFLAVATPVSEQLRWLMDQDPDYLLTPPSNLRALLEHARDTGLRPARLREVTTMAEMLGPGVRELCTEVWGVPLADAYSSQELGMIALQCPAHTHYHVQAENLLLEVLDDDDAPSAPGAVGRVVATDLHNFATPLIRYEIGDYAEAGAPCPCGRGLPVLNRIAGRVRNRLTLPGGVRRFVTLPIAPLIAAAPVRQFQVVQTGREDIEVKLVIPRPLTEPEEAALRDYFIASFGYPFRIAFTPVDEIPRTPGGKHEDVISRLGD
jgi:phenylacetate-CoA ligase